MPKDGQLHPTFPSFQRWVLDRLVGVFANDPTNVVLHIVSRWIEQNGEFLRSHEITADAWRRSQRPQGVVKDLGGRRRTSADEATSKPAKDSEAANGES